MIGFQQAWNGYLCAMHGHQWTWRSNYTGGQPPKGCMCARCGAVKK